MGVIKEGQEGGSYQIILGETGRKGWVGSEKSQNLPNCASNFLNRQGIVILFFFLSLWFYLS